MSLSNLQAIVNREHHQSIESKYDRNFKAFTAFWEIAIEQLILNSCALRASMYPVVGKTATKVDGERLVQNPTLSRNCDIF